jgi:hypothetical protein
MTTRYRSHGSRRDIATELQAEEPDSRDDSFYAFILRRAWLMNLERACRSGPRFKHFLTSDRSNAQTHEECTR